MVQEGQNLFQLGSDGLVNRDLYGGGRDLHSTVLRTTRRHSSGEASMWEPVPIVNECRSGCPWVGVALGVDNNVVCVSGGVEVAIDAVYRLLVVMRWQGGSGDRDDQGVSKCEPPFRRSLSTGLLLGILLSTLAWHRSNLEAAADFLMVTGLAQSTPRNLPPMIQHNQ